MPMRVTNAEKPTASHSNPRSGETDRPKVSERLTEGVPK